MKQEMCTHSLLLRNLRRYQIWSKGPHNLGGIRCNHKTKRGVCHNMALFFYIKKVSWGKRRIMKTQIFHHAKIIILKNPLKETRTLQDIIISWLISSFNTSQDIIFQKSLNKNRPILPGGQNPLSYYILYIESKYNILAWPKKKKKVTSAQHSSNPSIIHRKGLVFFETQRDNKSRNAWIQSALKWRFPPNMYNEYIYMHIYHHSTLVVSAQNYISFYKCWDFQENLIFS